MIAGARDAVEPSIRVRTSLVAGHCSKEQALRKVELLLAGDLACLAIHAPGAVDVETFACHGLPLFLDVERKTRLAVGLWLLAVPFLDLDANIVVPRNAEAVRLAAIQDIGAATAIDAVFAYVGP